MNHYKSFLLSLQKEMEKRNLSMDFEINAAVKPCPEGASVLNPLFALSAAKGNRNSDLTGAFSPIGARGEQGVQRINCKLHLY
jgi:hypothetical protein